MAESLTRSNFSTFIANGIFAHHKFRKSGKMTLKGVYIQTATFSPSAYCYQKPVPFKQWVNVRGEKANS